MKFNTREILLILHRRDVGSLIAMRLAPFVYIIESYVHFTVCDGSNCSEHETCEVKRLSQKTREMKTKVGKRYASAKTNEDENHESPNDIENVNFGDGQRDWTDNILP